MKRSGLQFVTLLAITFLAGTLAFAQSDRGSITGLVTDQSGAVVSNAKVTATDINTGEERSTNTDSRGNYTLPEVRASTYKITAEAPGFAPKTIDQVVVPVQFARRADITLGVGQVSTQLEVQAQGELLQTENAAIQTSVNERQIKELPLLVGGETAGRSPLSFVFLDSSVTSVGGAGTNTANFRVNGNQGGNTDILIDGAATRRAQNGDFFTEVAPGPNAYQEFTVTTSQYSAEYGSAAGGVVNFTIKSGGNHIHGEAYDLMRHDRLDANSWYNNNKGLPKNRDHQNDFGANIGGPLVIPHLINGKDKAFWFFNYEGYRFNNGENVDVTIPTLKMRTGDFSELLKTCWEIRH